MNAAARSGGTLAVNTRTIIGGWYGRLRYGGHSFPCQFPDFWRGLWTGSRLLFERAVTFSRAPTVIIRISRGRVRPGTEGDVFARLRAATEERGRPEGLNALFIGRHLTAEGLELVAITVWADVEALISVVGEGWESPKWLAGLEDLVTDSSVEHLETAVEDFEAFIGQKPMATGAGAADGQVYGG